MEPGRCRLLVIEDDPDNAYLAVETMRTVPGFEVEVADRLATGLERLAGGTINLVLLDLGLPDSKGIDTLRAVRRAAPRVPVVVITGEADEETGLEAVREGAQGFVVKGRVEPRGLRRELRFALERHRLAEALRASEAKIGGLFDNMTEGVLFLAADGTVLDVNRAALAMFDLTREELLAPATLGQAWRIIDEDGKAILPDEHPSTIALKTGQPVRDRILGVRNPGKGELRWLSVTAIPQVRPGEDWPCQVFVTLHDITARKWAEHALRESEESYRQLFEAESDAIFLMDNRSGRILQANPAASVLYGYSRDELLALKNTDLSAEPEETRKVTQGTPIDHDRVIVIPLRHHRKKDGTVFPVEITGRFFVRNGAPVHLVAIRDITERRRTEEALWESEARFRSQYQALPIPTYTWEVEGDDLRLVDCNRIARDLSGGKAVNLFGVLASALYRDRPEILTDLRRCLATREVVRREVESANFLPGRTVIATCAFVPPNLVMVHLEDVTERRQAEATLRESEERFRVLFEQAGDIILMMEINPAGIPVIRDANRTAFQLLGYQREELIGQPVTFLDVDPDGSSVTEERRRKILVGTGNVFEVRHRCKDGTVREFECSVKELQIGSMTLGISVERDITERRLVEAALRKSETRYRELGELLPVAVFETDRAGRLTFANQAAFRLFGYASEDFAAGLTVAQTIAPADRARAGERIGQILSGAPGGNDEYLAQRKDGTTFPVRIFSEAIRRDGAVAGLRGVLVDLTEQRRLQASMTQSDRLASMGMLAAGVAHEINNPLSYVMFNTDLLRRELPGLKTALLNTAGRAGRPPDLDPAALDQCVTNAAEAQEGALRIRDIVRGLGMFARVEPTDLHPVDVNDVLECATSMAFNEIKYRARLVKDFGRLPPIVSSEGRLSQLFLNLLINAAQAIDEGARERNEIKVRSWSADGAVFVEVSDTGQGISPEDLGRVFVPFFTSKPGGESTGLGLSICRDIVVGLGGEIVVASEVGRGARFTVRLPVGAPAAADRPAFPAAMPGPAVRGRILVVDDEPAIRAMTKRLLGSDHEVVTADGGEQAKALLAKDQRFDLILCDLMMPRVSGTDLHQWLAATHPLLAGQVVFVTGGAFTPKAREYLARIDNLRVQKPFEADSLLRLVGERVLAARGPAMGDKVREAP